jgi:zinc D-Ala-D-Ala carboxypeptidase
MQRNKRLVLVALSLAIIAGLVLVVRAQTTDNKPQPATGKQQAANQPQPAAFDKRQYSLDTPTSPWVIVNKRRPLKPVEYVPQLAQPNVGLRLSADVPEMQVSQQIKPALEQMFAAAKQDGLSLIIASAYRSYKVQVSVYGNEVNRNGQQAADRESARPGYSEHQTGLAVDIGPASRQCEVEVCFGDLPEGKWLAANAYRYGFVIRYGQNNEPITGYSYEPWHLRYVGTELATELNSKGNPPLETFFELGAAAGY